MQNYTCLNCGEPQMETHQYCGRCGQSYHIHRFTLKHFFHEFFHAFTHTDKGIFHLLKRLASRPGTTAREYILGKRKYYFNPFTFFLILMTIFVLSNNLFKKEVVLRKPNAAVLNRIPTPAGKEKYLNMLERGNNADKFFRNNGNIVAMVAIPFISLFTWLAFRRRGFNYAEHLTANMMFVAFSNLIFTLLIFPLAGYLGKGNMPGWLTPVAMLLQAIYFGWALNGLLLLRTTGQRLKSMLLSLIVIILWAIFSVTVMAIYIYRSWDFYKFFQFMAN